MQHLRALVFLTDLRLIKRETELVSNHRREARQPNERIDKPNQLAWLLRLFRHASIVCQNWHKVVVEDCNRHCSSSKSDASRSAQRTENETRSRSPVEEPSACHAGGRGFEPRLKPTRNAPILGSNCRGYCST